MIAAAALARPTIGELVAVFDAKDVLDDAVGALQSTGFSMADMYVLLPEDLVKKHPGHVVPNPANDPNVLGGEQVDVRSMGVFQGALISVPAYILACLMIASFTANGANLGATIITAVVGGGIGGVLGVALFAWVKRGHFWRIKHHVDHGDLILWVVVRNARCEKRANEILARYPVRDYYFRSLV